MPTLFRKLFAVEQTNCKLASTIALQACSFNANSCLFNQMNCLDKHIFTTLLDLRSTLHRDWKEKLIQFAFWEIFCECTINYICQRLSLIFNILFTVYVCINKAVLSFKWVVNTEHVCRDFLTVEQHDAYDCNEKGEIQLLNTPSVATKCCFVEWFVNNVKTILLCK